MQHIIKNFFPIILAIIDIFAGLVFLYYKDYNRMIYWFAAATLTITVIRM